MGEWDLTAKIGPYLDRHLVFPLLEFLSHKVGGGVVCLAIIKLCLT